MKLNLGAGQWRPTGYTSVDLSDAEICHDLNRHPWPFAHNRASHILASHVLEHFTRADGVHFLATCWDTLAYGGTLYVAVPDMDRFIDCRLSGDWSALNGYHWRDLNHLMGGDETERNPAQRHKYMYCAASLLHTLWSVGFTARQIDHIEGLHNPAYRAISLYVEGIK